MRIARKAAVAALALLVIVGSASPAEAARRLKVSKTKGLQRSGETVTVTGSGYDTTKGIYVAFCLDNGAGVLPSPCGGGADMTGSSGGSAWISSNPPSYGEGLATPYGKGGSFTVSIRVSQMIGDVDCAIRGCAIVTRNDHTRTNDRSQDVRVPVRFAAAPTTTTAPVTGVTPTAGSVAVKPAKTPVGPPSALLATAAPPSAEAMAAAAEVDARPTVSLSRTSSAESFGKWWAVGGAFLAGLLTAAATGRLRRRKRAGAST